MADSPNSSELSSPESPEEAQQGQDDPSGDEVANSSDSESNEVGLNHGDVDNRVVMEYSESSSDGVQDNLEKNTDAVSENSDIGDSSKNSDISDEDSTSEILDKNGTFSVKSVENSGLNSSTKDNNMTLPISPRPMISASRPSMEKPRGLDSLEGELDFEAEVHVKEDRDDQNVNDEMEDIKPTDGDSNLPPKKDKENEPEEGEQEEGEQDDGEVSGEDDLEEGEVKDGFPDRKARPPPVCRFFNRGQCTWGTNCRFIHPGVNDKGNYNMFASNKAPPIGPGIPPGVPPPPLGPIPIPIGNPRLARGAPDFMIPPPIEEPPPVESAWERGLRHAKEILKKASRRKEQEPDFEEKRLNLTIEGPDRGPEYEKDDFYCRSPFRRPGEAYGYGYGMPEEEPYDNLEREAREFWRGGRYENFEVRWPRPEYEFREPRERERERNRPAFRPSYERENPGRVERRTNEKERWREERHTEVQAPRSRGDEWRDPWRRSKTPKGRRSTSRSRGRSHRSYSSGSSRSYSSGSSKSSYSYSRSSSSRSSYYSSRSRSYSRSRSHSRSRLRSRSHTPPVRRPEVKTEVKRRAAPVPVRPSPAKTRVKTPPVVERRKRTTPPIVTPPVRSQPSRRRVEADRYKKTRTPSYSGSDSNRSVSHSLSSSRSRSVSRSQSHSPSRSYSRSLSMSSVSSASSSASHSSTGSESDVVAPPKKGLPKSPRQSKKPAGVQAATAESAKGHEKDPKISGRTPPVSRDNVRSKDAETTSAPVQDDPDVLPHERRALDALTRIPLILPMGTPKGSKDPLKQSGHKQQIKLTLLNKAPAEKTAPKEDVGKAKNGDESIKGGAKQSNVSSSSRKRPLSPVLPAAVGPKSSSNAAVPPVSGLKKSTSSRREELLKQLKAVEDAIARKRAKLN